MSNLPTGTVTFLFSDIEGSTRILNDLGNAFPAVLDRHSRIIESAVAEAGGVVVKVEGDGYFAAFQSAISAVEAAVSVQRSLASEEWPPGHPVRVRIGIHTGEGRLGGPDYVGMDVHRAARISDCGHGGQTLLSEPTVRLTEYSLPEGATLEDLGVHELRDLPHPEHLYQLNVEGLQRTFPPLRTLTPVKGNLPQRASDFVGRQGELETLTSALRQHRLVTLTGPAGIGKTALALAAARQVTDMFADGMWLAEVSRVNDENLLPSTIARQLRITESPNEALTDTLASRLARSEMLLILDGCEHMVEAVAKLVDHLLQWTTKPRVLVTSRELIAIRGEQAIVVSPLDTPPPGVQAPSRLAAFDSVALFVDRARLVQPDFQLDGANAPLVAEICRRLDGIPLAIELAAARLKMLSVGQVVERLDHELSLLSRGSRDLLPHQQTLQGTLDWSHQLLTRSEQRLFARLSVFSGGFTIEAAETVCSDDILPAAHILDILGRLVDTSLVIRAGFDPVRYRLLEPIAQYARRRLSESGETEGIRRSHARYFLDLAEKADAELLGRDQAAWAERLDHERDNLRSALAWFRDRGEPDELLRMAAALRWFWTIRRDVREGWGWLETALAGREAASLEAVARALNGAGVLAIRRVDLERAEQALTEACDIYAELGDAGGQARQVYHLATLALFRDDLEGADREAARAQEMSAAAGDDWTTGWSLAMRGTVARLRGDLVTAERHLLESHEVFDRMGGLVDVGWSLLRLGALYRDRGAYEQAAQHYAQGRIRLQEAGDRLGVAHADAGLAAMAWLGGDHERALDLFQDVLEHFGLSEETVNNLFELKTMIQSNPTMQELQQIVEWNRVRATMKEGRVGAMRALAEYLLHVGLTATRQGQAPRAAEALTESSRLAADSSDTRGLAVALAALARAHLDAGSPEEAARALGAAKAADPAGGWIGDQGELSQELRAALGHESFERLRAEGGKQPEVGSRQ